MESGLNYAGDVSEFAQEDAEETKESSDRWFDQWLIARGKPLKELVDATAWSLEFHEKKTEARKRARRSDDQKRWETMVEALVCNLAYAVLSKPETGYLAIRRGKDRKLTRYDNTELSPKVVSTILDQFEEVQIIEQIKGSAVGGLTRIAPTDWFARRTHERGVQFEDFGRSESEEVIVLSRKSKSIGSKGIEKRTQLIDYKDTENTNRLRADVRSLNRYLEGADFGFVDDGIEPKIDPYQRRLTRRFVLPTGGRRERFDCGGRLFGGFWMNAKKDRRSHIRIQGERPVVLDFSSMFARLAYAKLGLPAPDTDLYDLEGSLKGYRPEHRDGVKQAFNTLFFGGGKRLPSKIKRKLPEGATMRKVREAIEQLHPALGPLMETEVGYELMFTESRILIAVLKELQSRDVVALPLHDAIMTASSKAEEAQEVMTTLAEEICGHTIPVSLKQPQQKDLSLYL
jgi:hypothetical protein